MKKILRLVFIVFTSTLSAQVANQPNDLVVCEDNFDGVECFMLSAQNAQVLGSQSPVDFSISYHATQADADNATNLLSPSSYCNTSNPQTIYVRLADNSNGMFDTTSFQLVVGENPAVPSPGTVTPILVCDADNDLFVEVDLLSRETEIINTNTNVVVTYHQSFSDADAGVNSIVNPDGFQLSTSNFSNPGIASVYARVESTLPLPAGNQPCYSIAFMQIVNTKPLFSNTSYNYRACVDDTSYTSTFNLQTIMDEVSFQNSQLAGDFTITYHLTEADVLSNTAALPNEFQNTTNQQILYIRAENDLTGCVATGNIPTLTLDVQRNPVINQNLIPLEKCDSNGNGIALFRIINEINDITDGESLALTFYETEADAENATNEINAGFYFNTTPFAQTIYVRIENTNNCYTLTTLELIVNSECLPTNTLFRSYICDYDTPGLGCFDLTSRVSEALGNTSPSDVIVTYHLSDEDAFNNVNPIANPETFCTTALMSTIHIRKEEVATGIATATAYDLIGLEIAPNINMPTPLIVCDPDDDGITTFPLASKVAEIFDDTVDYAIRFYETETDAAININAINLNYTNVIPYSQTIYARIYGLPITYPNAECFEIVPLELITDASLCNVSSTENYEVTTIPHVIYNFLTTPTVNLDDTFTFRLDIPFDFNFFGETYDEFVIGTNGIVSFEASYSNAECDPSMDVARSIPSPDLYRNSIFGVYHDMQNVGNGSIAHGVVGEAPFRKFIIFFEEVNQFLDTCDDPSTSQIVLYETLNIVDVQVAQKIACNDWNGGLALLGIQGRFGLDGYFPENRNTGVWNALDEGYRFTPLTTYENVFFISCDDGSDGFFEFDLATFETTVLGDITTGTVSYFDAEEDLLNNNNELPALYTNTRNSQVLYARVFDSATNETTIKTVTLAVINCDLDTDADGVATADEDVNGDGDLGNDDTDGDGIPDFIDEDDDGDFVLTQVELVNTAGITAKNGFLDTDDDGIPNHRDADDDGDGTLTIDEDYNGNNNPEDDDTNNNNIPDYLDNLVSLSVDEFTANNIRMYPNPARENITIETTANMNFETLSIYSVEGRLVHEENQAISNHTITLDVRNFASGFYILKVQTKEKGTFTKQFIVE